MKKLIIAVIILTSTVSLFSQTKDLVAYYDSELFKINYQTIGGLNLNYQGQSVSTSMGIPQYYKGILSEYDDVNIYIESYSKKNLYGNILLYGGLGAAMFGAYYPLFTMDESTTSDQYLNDYKFALGMMIGGLVSTIIGSVLVPSSFQELTQGVNLFNRHKIEEF